MYDVYTLNMGGIHPVSHLYANLSLPPPFYGFTVYDDISVNLCIQALVRKVNKHIFPKILNYFSDISSSSLFSPYTHVNVTSCVTSCA